LLGTIHTAHTIQVAPISFHWFRGSMVFHLTLGSRELSALTILTFTTRCSIYARIMYLAPTSLGENITSKAIPRKIAWAETTFSSTASGIILVSRPLRGVPRGW